MRAGHIFGHGAMMGQPGAIDGIFLSGQVLPQTEHFLRGCRESMQKEATYVAAAEEKWFGLGNELEGIHKKVAVCRVVYLKVLLLVQYGISRNQIFTANSECFTGEKPGF